MVFQLKVRPKVVLIDCSELELGRNLGQRRGRPDDNLESYKRRLQLYREFSLPMLKTLDEDHRLRIVDGDVEESQIISELIRTMKKEMEGFANDERKSNGKQGF